LGKAQSIRGPFHFVPKNLALGASRRSRFAGVRDDGWAVICPGRIQEPGVSGENGKVLANVELMMGIVGAKSDQHFLDPGFSMSLLFRGHTPFQGLGKAGPSGDGSLFTTRRISREDIGTYQEHCLHSRALCCNSTEVNLSLNSDNPPSQSNLNAVGEKTFADLGHANVLQGLRSALFANSLIFMGIGIWLAFLVSSNLTTPLQEIIRVLKRVRDGDFDGKVGVTTNNEIGYTGDVINEMNEGLKELDFVKETFGRYVAREVRDKVLSGWIPLDGEMKEVTILFADLRDFTPMTESHNPKFVVKVLNNNFREMAEAIHQKGGLVLQFLGDEIYAVFGAPILQTDHPVRAFRATVAMKERFAALNERFSEQGWPCLRHGVGIHTGQAIAASIGSPDRLSYLLVGDTVNAASRLQELTKELNTEIIISEGTRSRLEGDLPLQELPAARLKGNSRPVKIFALV